MALAPYRRKRHFGRTPEPRGQAVHLSHGPRAHHARGGRGKPPRRASRRPAGLAFVVQEHHARRLHFDFRLELGGTLKSWAVPKGPPMTPGERRLAVHVEDHPLEYGSFRGEIPKGEYGAGKVEIWDRGTWTPKGEPFSSYEKGKLEFRLEGDRLRGYWVLVKMHGPAGEDGKNWLLIKERDEPALSISPRVPEGRPAPMPDLIEPQLATLATRPPEGVQWLHEVKFDGYRILARIDEGKVRLLSRNGKDWTSRFGGVEASLKRLRVKQAWIDGEVVVLDEEGRSDFQALQNAMSGGSAIKPVYYVFDMLYADGRDLRDSTLVSRKAALAALVGENAAGTVRFTGHMDGKGSDFYREACRLGLEGIMSKLRDSPYRGGRSAQWMKTKCLQEQEFVIAGYTEPKGSRAAFGALLLAVQDPRHRLRYAGRVGTGFTEHSLQQILTRLKPLKIERCPFPVPPPDSKDARWVEPRLVAEIAFASWTQDGVLRQPSFRGLREDKPAQAVAREKAVAPPRAPREAILARPRAAGAGFESVAGVRLTHPERVLYPSTGLTKRDLARFYEHISERILPYIAGRPLAIIRCPEGIGEAKKCFFQKHVDSNFPQAIKSIEIEEKSQKSSYICIEDLAGLISLVQIGALELHPWGSQVETLEQPDVMVFDLDPAEDAPWDNVIAAARELRELLLELKLASFLKTTGGKGLHVVVPLQPDAVWEQVKEFSKQVALTLVGEHPKLYTANLSKNARTGKVFIDYLRNGRGATAIAPYSTRAKPGAPVSAPIDWEELGSKLRSDRYNVSNLAQHLKERDPWTRYAQVRQSIKGRHFLKIGNV